MDNVPVQYQVKPSHESEYHPLETVEEAINVYVNEYRKAFTELVAKRRAWELKRFVRYLKSENHSMKTSDLTYADGQGFLDALKNPYTGSELSLVKKKDYRGALRSFSRFLHQAGILEQDLFFSLRIR